MSPLVLALAAAAVVLVLAVVVVARRGTPRAAEDVRFRRAAEMTSTWSAQSGVTVRPSQRDSAPDRAPDRALARDQQAAPGSGGRDTGAAA